MFKSLYSFVQCLDRFFTLPNIDSFIELHFYNFVKKLNFNFLFQTKRQQKTAQCITLLLLSKAMSWR